MVKFNPPRPLTAGSKYAELILLDYKGFEIETDPKKLLHNYLTGAVLYVDSGTPYAGFGGTVGTPTVLKVELWLTREGSHRVFLDSGYAIYDTQYNRAVVGFEGCIEYKKGDILQAFVWNQGTGTANYAVDYTCVREAEHYACTINRLHSDVTAIYQARRATQQENLAGGAIKVDVTLATGQMARLIAASGTNTGTNSAYIHLRDEDAALTDTLCAVASAAGTMAAAPCAGQAGASSGGAIAAQGLILPAGAMLSFEQAGAGAQHDYLQVAVVLELIGDFSIPTWAKSRSTNEADVTIGASSISATNTMQYMVRPRMVNG